MKELKQYILEAKLNVDTVIKTYLDNFDKLSDTHKQHFQSRLSLCGEYETPSKDTFKPVADKIRDILKHIDNDELIYIRDEYALAPYMKNQKKKPVKDFLSSIANHDALYYIACEELFTAYIILLRNDAVDLLSNKTIKSINKIDIDRILAIHNLNTFGCRDHCGTIYINLIGALMTIYPENQDIKDAWISSRRYYNTYFDVNEIFLYAITHIIINATNFYTKQIDVNEYKLELSHIEETLKYLRQKDYKSKELSLDVIAEIGLCDKILQGKEWKHVAEFLRTKINQETNIIQNVSKSVKDNLDRNEHCNILYIMLNKLTL